MDPLSVSASVIGVLTAAAKVSSILSSFIQNTRETPKLALAVLNEVNALRAALDHLQSYLLGAISPSKSRATLILVEQVIVTLTECIMTFSELEEILGTSKHGAEIGTWNRMKWAMKESKSRKLLEFSKNCKEIKPL